LIEDLERQIDAINRDLRAGGADHPYVPLLLTVPGIGWVLAFTIAAEIGDITRFATAKKLVGYTGLCPRVNQSGAKDRRGPLTKHGPKYLRWAMLEATMHASRHPAYCERYQRNKRRLGRQRGAKVAQIDIARPGPSRVAASGACATGWRSSPRLAWLWPWCLCCGTRS
jgi:transposase